LSNIFFTRVSSLIGLTTLTVIYSGLSAQAETVNSAKAKAIVSLDTQSLGSRATTLAEDGSPKRHLIAFALPEKPVPGKVLTSASNLRVETSVAFNFTHAKAIALLHTQSLDSRATAPNSTLNKNSAHKVSLITVARTTNSVPGKVLTSASALRGEIAIALPRVVAQADQTIPGTITPGTTTPYQTIPNGTTPGTITPGTTTPYQTIPNSTTPGTITPDQTIPNGTTPGTITPGTTTPEQTTPYGTTPGTTTPGETQPNLITPGTPSGPVAPSNNPTSVAPGGRTIGGPSYVGVAGNIGISGGETSLGVGSFTIISKIGLLRNISVRPAAVIGDNTTVLIPLTYDFTPLRESIATRAFGISPYLGAGVAINTGGNSDVGALVTGGVDLPLTRQFTATAGVNVGFLNNTSVGVLIGIGYNFGGL